MTPSFFPMKTWLRHSQRRTLARDGQDSPSRPASCFGTVRRLQTSSRALQHRRTIDDERQGGSGLAGEDHGGDGGAGPQGFPTGAGANPTTSARRLGSRSPRPVVWVIIDAPPPLSVQPPQKTAFLCQAKCTDMRGPQEEFHRCLEQCGQPIARHEQAVMSELQGFQQRVQRCVVQCQDRQASSKDEAKYEKCISECAVFYQKELAQLRPKLLKKP